MNTIFSTIGNAVKRHGRRPSVVAGGAGAVLLLVAITVAARGPSVPPQIVVTGEDGGEEQLRTVRPVLISGTASTVILGTVFSNEIANVYPRREGIVEDIYVDIGDTVAKNQVVALLLPPGVEGQGAAMIAEKRAMQAQAQTELDTSAAVRDRAVLGAEQMIAEKQAELDAAYREQKGMFQEMQRLHENVGQSLEQMLVAVRGARQLMEQIIIGSNSRGGAVLREYNIMDQLGLLSFQTRYDLINAFTVLNARENGFVTADTQARADLADSLIAAADDAIIKATALLTATPTVSVMETGRFTYGELTDMMNMILEMQGMVYMAKEKWEDAENMFLELTKSEPALFEAWRSGRSPDTAESNDVLMLKAQVQSAERELGVVASEQTQMVEQARAMLGVAGAAVQVEIADSGHREIRSPFAGVVSKRFLRVGEQVMSSMPAFELVGVQTTLAKKAKAEIEFGLPEDLIGAVETGDELTFVLAADESAPYRAVVTRISAQVDSESRTVTARARVEDGVSVPSNASVRVYIARTALPVYRLPSYAVKREGGTNVLWIRGSGEHPVRVTVEVQSEDGEFAEITGDLSEDTVILLDPPELLAEHFATATGATAVSPVRP